MKLLILILLFTLFVGVKIALGQCITEPCMDFTRGHITAASINEIYEIVEKWDKGLSELYEMLGMERKRHTIKGHSITADLVVLHQNHLNENLAIIWQDTLLALESMAEKQGKPEDFSLLKPGTPQQVINLNPPLGQTEWIGKKDLFMNCFVCGKHMAPDEDSCFRTDYWGRVVLVHSIHSTYLKKSREENAK